MPFRIDFGEPTKPEDVPDSSVGNKELEPEEGFASIDDLLAGEGEVAGDGISLAPTASRIAGGIAGGVVGAAVGGPLGASIGSGIGSVAGDAFAQMLEMQEGSRDEFNPGLSVVEWVFGTMLGGGKTLGTAAAKAAGFGLASVTAREVVEGRPIPPPGELAIVGLTSAVLGAGGHALFGRTAKETVKEITGEVVDEDMWARMAHDPDIARVKASLDPIEAGSGKWSFDDISAEQVKTRVSRHADAADMHAAFKVEPKFSTKRVKNKTPAGIALFRNFIPQQVTMERVEKKLGVPAFRDFYTIRRGFDRHQNELNGAADDLSKIFHFTRGPDRLRLSAAMRAASGVDRDALMDAQAFTVAERAKVRQLESFYDRYTNKLGVSPEDVKRLSTITDELDRADAYIHDASFKYHLGEDWEIAYQKWSKLKGDNDAKDAFITFLNAVRGSPSKTAEKVDAFFSGIFRKLGMKEMDSRQWASNYTALTYTSALGFRPASIIQNSLAPIHNTWPLLGTKYFNAGWKQAFTREGRALAEKAGVIRGQAIDLAEVKAISAGPVTRAIQAVSRKALYLFQTSEELVRTHAYLGFRQKYLDAAKLAGDDVTKWVDIGDIDRFHKAPREMLEALYASGNRLSAVETAAEMQVRNTQHDYSVAGRPPILTGEGKFLGSFLTYPLSQLTWFANNFANGAGPRHKVLRDFSRWAAANAAILGTLGAAGTAFGDEDSWNDGLGRTFVGAMLPGVSPGAEQIRAMLETGQALAQLQGKKASKEFRQGFRIFTEPGVVRDIARSQEEGNLGAILGLRRGAK